MPPFRISLAEWSLHRAIRGGTLEHLDFPATAKRDYGIEGVEYVSTLFKAHDDAYLRELKTRAADQGVRSLLIMCDAEGRLGDPDPAMRSRAFANHVKWLDAAALLGCHSIRVNAESEGTRAGLLPDFGNFYEKQQPAAPDRYAAVRMMMPYAHAVSAKSYAFDAEGNESIVDYRRMISIVTGSGYRAWIGIEYEGEALPEPEGIRATKALLEKLR